jgi:hypothetical protein
MKTLSIIILSIFFWTGGQSQEFKKIQVSIGTGIASTLFTDSGPLLYLQPSYHLSDKFMIGGRLESAFLFDENGSNIVASYGLSSKYYFSTKKEVRTYAGVGIGFYSTGSLSSGLCDCDIEKDQNNLGFYPTAGFDYKHLTISLEYNLIRAFNQSTRSIIPGNTSPPTISSTNLSYLSLKVAVTLGGGKVN